MTAKSTSIAFHTPGRGLRLSACAAALLLSACGGQSPGLIGETNLASQRNQQQSDQAEAGMTELQKATNYWGQRYAKEPHKLENAMSFAKNLKAIGQDRKALAVLQNASRIHSTDKELASEYARLALKFDQVAVAEKLLAVADDPARPDWRVISAIGTVHAKRGQFSEAIPYFERALAMAPEKASVLNNLAMAHAMKGDAEKAESLLRQASLKPGDSKKVHQNLALVLGLQGRYDEAKTTAVASAKSDTDVIRQIVKLEPKQQPPSFRPSVVNSPAVAEANDGWSTAVAANARPSATATSASDVTFRGPQR